MRRSEPAQGSIKHSFGRVRTMPRVVVPFEKDTLEEIRSMAKTNSISFAEQVRVLVEWGLESAK